MLHGIFVFQAQAMKCNLGFNNDQAFAEGWGLFDDGCLQRLDCGPYRSGAGDHVGEPCFASDWEAFRWVQIKAKEGSEYHTRALMRVHSCWSTLCAIAEQLDRLTTAAQAMVAAIEADPDIDSGWTNGPIGEPLDQLRAILPTSTKR